MAIQYRDLTANLKFLFRHPVRRRAGYLFYMLIQSVHYSVLDVTNRDKI